MGKFPKTRHLWRVSFTDLIYIEKVTPIPMRDKHNELNAPNSTGKSKSNWLGNTLSAFTENYIYNIPGLGNLLRLLNVGQVTSQGVSDFMNTYDADNMLKSWLFKMSDAGATGRDVALNRMNMQNIHDSWQQNVSGMVDAGLNPALMYGGSSSSSAPSLSNGGAGASLSDLIALISLPTTLKRMNAETRNINADTKSVETRTEETSVDIEFKKRTIDARSDGVRLQNELSRSEIAQLNKSLDVADAEIVKMYREAESYDSVIELNTARAVLARADAYKISALLPLEKAYMSAETDKEKKLANFYLVQTAYQQGLIDKGMIEALVSKTKAEASLADIEAYLSNPEYEPISNLHDSKIVRYLGAALRQVGRFIPFNSLMPSKNW